MVGDVRPYAVPGPGTVVWAPWSIRERDEWTPLGDDLPGWDPATNVELRCGVRVAPDALLRDTGLREVRDVALTVSWTSSSTGMTGSVPPLRLPADGVTGLDVVLPGPKVGGVVRLRRTLAWVGEPLRPRPGVVNTPGAILSEDTRDLDLRGPESAFSVHALDFAGTHLDPAASWHLETTTDLEAPFRTGFRLLVNTKDSALVAALTKPQGVPTQDLLVDELHHEVAQLLLDLASSQQDEVLGRTTWLPDSVGDVLARVLRSAGLTGARLPSAEPEELAERRTRLAGAARSAGHGRPFE